MPDPGNDISGHQVHESKVRASPPNIQVQPRQKDDGHHGETDKGDRQQGVHLAEARVALRWLQQHLDQVEGVEGEGAEAKHESTVAQEGGCMGRVARVGIGGLASEPGEEVDEEEARAEEEEEEQSTHLQSSSFFSF